MTESLIGFAVLLLLIFLRVPIAFAMTVVGAAGFAQMRGWDATLALTGNVIYETGLSYTLSVVPLFIFMGNVLSMAGVSHGLFAVANRIAGRARGGVAISTVIACGGFSAVCGSSLATAATMSKVAMPSMRRFGYADSLASGAIAAGGTLGILIPPSVILIIYGILTETDIGDLFVAGVIPGAIGLAFYIAAVAVVVRLNPRLAQQQAETTALTRTDLVVVGCVVMLFAVIMIGIYGGLFTPTEAAGVGAAVALAVAAGLGSLTLAGLGRAVRESAQTTAMIFAVIIGAEIFTNFVNFAGLPDAIASGVGALGLSPWLVIMAMVLIYLLLGCVLESLSMILLTVPIFYPLIQQLDFTGTLLADPNHALIWFGIVVVVATEISLITPPIGLNVFVLNSVLPDVSLRTIFTGVLPFWIADIVRLALLVAVPWLSLRLIL